MSVLNILLKLVGYDGTDGASSTNPFPVQLIGSGGTEYRDTFASGAGPFTLTHPWDGNRFLVFFDGLLQPVGNLVATLASTTVTLGIGVNPTFFTTIEVVYTS